jgi:hypothetical protein
MPHHDFEDGPPNLLDWIYDRLSQLNQPGGAHGLGHDKEYVPPPPPSRPWYTKPRTHAVWLTLLLMVFVAAGIKTGVIPALRAGAGRPPAPASLPPQTLYAQRPVRVHSGAGQEFPVVRTVSSGEQVRTGQRDDRHWAPFFNNDHHLIGYAYLSDGTLGSEPPAQARRSPPPEAIAPDTAHARDTSYAAGATAICRDGTPSMSRHRSGTCSGHLGVATWINRPAN